MDEPEAPLPTIDVPLPELLTTFLEAVRISGAATQLPQGDYPRGETFRKRTQLAHTLTTIARNLADWYADRGDPLSAEAWQEVARVWWRRYNAAISHADDW